MKIEWQNNSANIGRLELRVRRSDYTGKWNAMVFIVINQIGSHHDFETDAAARAWCEQWVEWFVGPALAAARAEGAAAEREACAQIARERAEMARLPSGWDAALAEALAIEAAIRARGAEDSES
jgi:hypothetical protein